MDEQNIFVKNLEIVHNLYRKTGVTLTNNAILHTSTLMSYVFIYVGIFTPIGSDNKQQTKKKEKKKLTENSRPFSTTKQHFFLFFR